MWYIEMDNIQHLQYSNETINTGKYTNLFLI